MTVNLFYMHHSYYGMSFHGLFTFAGQDFIHESLMIFGNSKCYYYLLYWK
uniref:Uncharacterized protein n=1 Tax=Rhizophora mucronata TaxID=61149 RepID=A0A2P2Q631_RHIMU